jgi:integrase
MTLRMTTLRRSKTGDWFSRKEIPKDVRKAYGAAHGRSREERFRRPATLSEQRAKQEFREWDATVSARIEALRAAARGEGQSLTLREAVALAGRWYIWFTTRREDEPGEPNHWDIIHGHFEDACGLPTKRRQAALTELARLPSFLAEAGTVLEPVAYERFVEAVVNEFGPACALLRRRATGDYSEDSRKRRFPVATATAGMTCWSTFEAWVKERSPAASTVDRWRSVFLALEQRFPKRDIGTITEEDAIAWKDTLVTEDRSATVANDIWLASARTVFGWAHKNKKIKSNPFTDVRVAVPRRKVKQREREFTEQEWRTILSATLQSPPKRMDAHNAAARRWIPWLCAYTGARPGEMAQLRAEDVAQSGGVWAVSIAPDAGTVKTSTARTVPLHEHLVAQGFVEFAKAKGSGPLFYEKAAARVSRSDPTRPRKGQWTKARDKLAEWVRALGVTHPDISPNHAWRHTFKRRASRAGIERGIRDAICGHSPRDVADEYETPTLEDMARALTGFPRYELNLQEGIGLLPHERRAVELL